MKKKYYRRKKEYDWRNRLQKEYKKLIKINIELGGM